MRNFVRFLCQYFHPLHHRQIAFNIFLACLFGAVWLSETFTPARHGQPSQVLLWISSLIAFLSIGNALRLLISTRRRGVCSFCWKSYRNAGPLMEGPNDVFICEGCIDVGKSLVTQEKQRLEAEKTTTVNPQPVS